MGWDAIEFDLIVPGMITTGPATVSFGLYLDEFSRALDERRNMIEPGGATPLDLKFGAGMIDNNVFADNFRKLIQGYKNLWDSRAYYSSDVLIDPANASDYEITDDDIIAIITQEVWDLFSDPFFNSILDLYTAAVINAMYTFYENTRVVGSGVGISDTIVQNFPTFTATGASYNYDTDQNIGEIDDSYLVVLGGATVSLTDNNQGGSIVTMSYSATRNPVPPVSFIWIAAKDGNGSSYDGSECTLLAKDLDGGVLSMNYTPAFVVSRNAVFGFDKPVTPYTSEFPFVESAQDAVTIFWAPKETAQTAEGSVQVFYFKPSGPVSSLALKDGSSEPDFYSENQILNIDIPNGVFIDLNNPGLEFVI